MFSAILQYCISNIKPPQWHVASGGCNATCAWYSTLGTYFTFGWYYA